MGQQKKLSIVVPVYNRADIVERTLRSIATQDRIQDTTLILVDNNSTDNTCDVLRRWTESGPGARLDVVLSRETAPGAPAARNNGLALTVTPWIMFFDSDDEMLPGLISSVLDEIDRDRADIIGWPIDQQLPGGSRRLGRFTTAAPFWNHLVHGILSTARYAARTSLVLKAGRWNNTVRGWDDFELGVRLMIESPRMVMLSELPMVRTYYTDISITGNSYSHDPDKWEHSLDLCEQSLRKARLKTTWIDVRRIILAADYAREKDHASASRLRKATLAPLPLRTRLPLLLIYYKCKLIRRGTTTFSALLFNRSIK